jgi:hypothetical protein
MPTDAEVDAIMRGEDPRADEDNPAPQPKPRAGTGRQPRETTGRPTRNPQPRPEVVPESDEPAPSQGVVLRWMDAATVVLEAGGKREIARVAGASVPKGFSEAADAKREAEERMPYGTRVSLEYPNLGTDGKPKYRDPEGRLLARVTAQSR